jgi:hypothetical protein
VFEIKKDIGKFVAVSVAFLGVEGRGILVFQIFSFLNTAKKINPTLIVMMVEGSLLSVVA